MATEQPEQPESELKWTTEKPTIPGYYWYRSKNFASCIVQFTQLGNFYYHGVECPDDGKDIPLDSEWYGPIKSPQEKVEEKPESENQKLDTIEKFENYIGRQLARIDKELQLSLGNRICLTIVTGGPNYESVGAVTNMMINTCVREQLEMAADKILPPKLDQPLLKELDFSKDSVVEQSSK